MRRFAGAITSHVGACSCEYVLHGATFALLPASLGDTAMNVAAPKSHLSSQSATAHDPWSDDPRTSDVPAVLQATRGDQFAAIAPQADPLPVVCAFCCELLAPGDKYCSRCMRP